MRCKEIRLGKWLNDEGNTTCSEVTYCHFDLSNGWESLKERFNGVILSSFWVMSICCSNNLTIITIQIKIQSARNMYTSFVLLYSTFKRGEQTNLSYKSIYCIDTSVLLENYQDGNEVFSISSLQILMTSFPAFSWLLV